MTTPNAADEDWDLLTSFFPAQWKELAELSGAMKGLRQDKSEENYLRILLMHLGCGFSMRETAVRAKQASLADLSDVALLKRLRKSKAWLHQLCCKLFEEGGITPGAPTGTNLRLIDATVVKEPGPTGSLWRVHYSLRWPALSCDYFKLTETEGHGTGESLRQYPIKPEDFILVDRGYCHASGIHYAASNKACVTVRLNPHGITLNSENGAILPLLKKLAPLRRTGQIAVWNVLIPLENQRPLKARLCAVRKTKAAIDKAVKRLTQKASRNQTKLQPETLVFAQYVMVLTTFPEEQFPARVILECYRFRWQIELVFKRFKQIAQLGHLPKQDEESAQAWLYGKLFVALLTEKIIRQANDFSPWGYPLPIQAHAESVA